jgi:hypothetical protein
MSTSTDTEQQHPPTELRIPTEVYSRIVGYIRPLQAWGQAKQQEFAERVTFDVAGVPRSEHIGANDGAA